VLKTAETKYYTDKLKQEKTNIRVLWKTYSDLLGKNKNRITKIDKIVYENRASTTDIDIANTFNHFFTNLANSLAGDFTRNDDYKKYLSNPSIQSMYLSNVEKEELIKEIKQLNVNKSPGLDSISPKVILASCDYISKPLLHIFNLSFSNGVFPTGMKVAKTIPLYKKNSRLDPGNYRPISLLSIFSKILERLMHKRLYNYLIKYNLLFDLQFGFRHNHSTVMALIEIVDNIRENIDKGMSVIGIFLDLSKAFDMVNYEKLLYKMHNYGIRGSVHNWFSSYLHHRKQVTFVNNVFSEPSSVTLGVPQGSVLGPLLFLLYVNDISNVLGDKSVRLFADDTNIFITGSNIDALMIKAQNSLVKLHSWFRKNNLLLNISKTCFTLFSKKIKNPDIFLKLEDTVIPQVDETKYLGVILDKNLSFNSHCNYVKSKLTKLSSVFHYISRFIDPVEVKSIYFAYALPYLQYGIELFGLSSKKNTNILQRSQNKLIKLLSSKGKYDSATEIHNKLQIFTVEQLTIYFVCNFVFKSTNGMLPNVFENYFVFLRDTNHRSHRFINNLIIPFYRTELGCKSVKYSGAKMWNDLPMEIREINTLPCFKKHVKKYILTNL